MYLAPLWFYSCLIDAESLPSVEKHRVHPKAFVIRDCLESELRPLAQRPPRPLSLLKQSLGRVGGLFPVLHCFGSDSRVTTTDCAGCAAAPCSCASNVVPIAYDARQPPALPSLLIQIERPWASPKTSAIRQQRLGFSRMPASLPKVALTTVPLDLRCPHDLGQGEPWPVTPHVLAPLRPAQGGEPRARCRLHATIHAQVAMRCHCSSSRQCQ